MKGLVAGLPAAQHTHSTLCSSISVCRGFVSGLLIFTPAGGAGGCFGLFSARGQRRRSGSGQPSPPPEFIGGFVCVLRSVWVWSSEIRVCCQHHPQTQKPKRWQPGQYLHMWSDDFLPQTTKTGSNRCKNVREGFMSRRQNKRLLFYVSAVPLNYRCHA